MDILNEYVSVFKNFKDFSGRTGKKRFWYFTIVNIVISIILGIIEAIIGLQILSPIFSLIVLVPSLAVGVRRMHDIGKDWWYILIPFYNIYLALQSGDEGVNEYGEKPLA